MGTLTDPGFHLLCSFYGTKNCSWLMINSCLVLGSRFQRAKAANTSVASLCFFHVIVHSVGGHKVERVPRRWNAYQPAFFCPADITERGSSLAESAHNFRVKTTSFKILVKDLTCLRVICTSSSAFYLTRHTQANGQSFSYKQHRMSFIFWFPGHCLLMIGKGDKLSSLKTLSVRLLGWWVGI